MQGQPRITTQKQQGCRVRKRVILGANHEDRYRHWHGIIHGMEHEEQFFEENREHPDP